MISPENEYIYNIILSIFLGFILVYIINMLYTSPRIIPIYVENYKNENIHTYDN
uniref:Uncharacterized protein n=1 Tax=viral metagenome TaxID=1070528 RepID=A0A6C0EF42_9ZZZZ